MKCKLGENINTFDERNSYGETDRQKEKEKYTHKLSNGERGSECVCVCLGVTLSIKLFKLKSKNPHA